jgi:hypothetical protein
MIGVAEGVSFSDPSSKDGARRGFRVLLQPSSLAAAQKTVAGEIRRPPASKDPIAVNNGLVIDGNRAFRYTYGMGDVYVEQWWIERTGGTFRVDIWTPASEQNSIAGVGDRVVRTFEVL